MKLSSLDELDSSLGRSLIERDFNQMEREKAVQRQNKLELLTDPNKLDKAVFNEVEPLLPVEKKIKRNKVNTSVEAFDKTVGDDHPFAGIGTAIKDSFQKKLQDPNNDIYSAEELMSKSKMEVLATPDAEGKDLITKAYEEKMHSDHSLGRFLGMGKDLKKLPNYDEWYKSKMAEPNPDEMGTGSLLAYVGMGAAGGALVGTAGAGVGAAPGAVIGGVGGAISWGAGKLLGQSEYGKAMKGTKELMAVDIGTAVASGVGAEVMAGKLLTKTLVSAVRAGTLSQASRELFEKTPSLKTAMAAADAQKITEKLERDALRQFWSPEVKNAIFKDKLNLLREDAILNNNPSSLQKLEELIPAIEYKGPITRERPGSVLRAESATGDLDRTLLAEERIGTTGLLPSEREGGWTLEELQYFMNPNLKLRTYEGLMQAFQDISPLGSEQVLKRAASTNDLFGSIRTVWQEEQIARKVAENEALMRREYLKAFTKEGSRKALQISTEQEMKTHFFWKLESDALKAQEAYSAASKNLSSLLAKRSNIDFSGSSRGAKIVANRFGKEVSKNLGIMNVFDGVGKLAVPGLLAFGTTLAAVGLTATTADAATMSELFEWTIKAIESGGRKVTPAIREEFAQTLKTLIPEEAYRTVKAVKPFSEAAADYTNAYSRVSKLPDSITDPNSMALFWPACKTIYLRPSEDGFWALPHEIGHNVVDEMMPGAVSTLSKSYKNIDQSEISELEGLLNVSLHNENEMFSEGFKLRVQRPDLFESIYPLEFQDHVNYAVDELIAAGKMKMPDGSSVLFREMIGGRAEGSGFWDWLASIKLFHGTKKEWGDKIKSGGFEMNPYAGSRGMAQGWGHYFAELQDVGKYYRDLHEGVGVLKIGDKELPKYVLGDEAYNNAYEAVKYHKGNIDEAAKLISRYGNKSELEKSVLEKLSDWKAQGIKFESDGGVLFKVEADYEPEHFLHWDKKLSEQSDYVKDKLKGLIPGTGKYKPRRREDGVWVIDRTLPLYRVFTPNETFSSLEAAKKGIEERLTGIKGQELYKTLSTELGGDEAASKFLNDNGIVGNKYLDAVSRGAKEGSHNFVIFDQVPKIKLLEEDGVEIFQKAYEGIAQASRSMSGNVHPSKIFEEGSEASKVLGDISGGISAGVAGVLKGVAGGIKDAKSMLQMVREMKAMHFFSETIQEGQKILPKVMQKTARIYELMGKTPGEAWTVEDIGKIVSKPKSILDMFASIISPYTFARIYGNEGHNLATELASGQNAIQNNSRAALRVLGYIMKDVKGASRENQKAIYKIMKKLSPEMDKVFVASRIADSEYGVQKKMLDKVDKAMKKKGANVEVLSAKRLEIQGKMEKLKAWKNELKPQFEVKHKEWERTVQGLAKQFPESRISLAAEDTADFQKYPWLKNLMQPSELEAVNFIKGMNQHYAQRIVEVGEKVVSEPFVHHSTFRSKLAEDNLKQRLTAMGVDPVKSIAYARFHSRGIFSKQMIPDIVRNMQDYIPDAEKRIVNADFWRVGKKDGWDYVSRAAMVKSSKPWREFFDRLKDAYVPQENTLTNRLARNYSSIEAIRILAFAPSAAFKHLFKIQGTWATTGFGFSAKHIGGALQMAAENVVRESVENGTWLKGVKLASNEIHEAGRSVIRQQGMLNALADIEALPITREFWENKLNQVSSITGIGIKAVENFDRAHSFLAAVHMAANQGMTAQQAIYAVYDNILKNNFLGGALNPQWMRNPKIRALALFQNTPFKILERRLVNAAKSGEAIKTAWGVMHEQGIMKSLKELADIKAYVREGEAEFKRNLMYDALKSQKDYFGTPVLTQTIKEMVVCGATIAGGAAIGLDFWPQTWHTPFLQVGAKTPTIAASPIVKAGYETITGKAGTAAGYETDDESFGRVSTFLRTWMGGQGAKPLILHKVIRSSENDVPEIYKGSKWQYLFSVPSKKED